MRHRIRICKNCNKYALNEKCHLCGTITNDPHPPKFSLDDKYIRYRVIDAYENDEES